MIGSVPVGAAGSYAAQLIAIAVVTLVALGLLIQLTRSGR